MTKLIESTPDQARAAEEHSASIHTVLAHTLSVIGYPYVLVPATAGLASWMQRDSGHEFSWQPLIVLVCVMAGIAFFAWQGTRTGRYSNFDISTRTERSRFYGVTIALMLGATALIAWQNRSHAALRPTAVATVLLAVSFAINSKLKISLHAIFAMYSAGLIYDTHRPWALGLAALAIGIGWSRVHLERHSPLEVTSGLALGLIGAFALNL